MGKPQQTVYADPHLLADPSAAAEELCDALQVNRRRDRRAVEKALVDGKREKKWFAYVARKVDPDLARAALALDLPGVGSYPEEKRTYPLKAAAAQVLGFAGMENTGLEGIELLYDKELSGKPGSETIVRDPAGHALKTVAHQEPASGQNVRLTLDSQIQCYAEDVLKETVRDTGGKSAVSIVMDPRTGEVLAMANVTREGFHGFGKGDRAAEKNRAVTDVYEPGSIFKLVTISGALADGIVEPETTFNLPPSIHVADREINESHPRGTVTYSVREILQWSSNVGAVTIGMKMEQGRTRQVDRRLRLRQADRDPVPGRGERDRRAGRGLVRLVDRQHPHGAGHRGDAHPDGQGLLGRRLQRLGGQASPGRPGGRDGLRRGREGARDPGQGGARGP